MCHFRQRLYGNATRYSLTAVTYRMIRYSLTAVTYRMMTSFLCQVVCLSLLIVAPVQTGSQDTCDMTIWNIDNDAHGVQHVVGSCAEGHLEWRSPTGAIRLSLQTGLNPFTRHPHNVPFEACFTVSVQYASVKIFRDLGPTLDPLLLLTPDLTRMEKEMCFVSGQGSPILLFLESGLDAQSAVLGLIQIDYDIRRLSPTYSEEEDCRPCTDEEVLEAVCVSDFVVTGFADDVSHDDTLDESTVSLKVNKVFRQRQPLFRDKRTNIVNKSRPRRYPKLKFHTSTGVVEWPDPEDSLADTITPVSATGPSDGVVYVPRKCGIRKGPGEFMFIGRIRLRKPLLRCAPRLDDFYRLWNQAMRTQHNLCVLD